MKLSNDKENGRRQFIKNTALGVAAASGLGFFRAQAATTDSASWITVTATLKLRPEHADAAIAALKELVSAVEANEPGVIAYICNRGIQDRNEIKFFEIYANQAATLGHRATAHFKSHSEKTAGFYEGAMEVVAYERIAGFHR